MILLLRLWDQYVHSSHRSSTKTCSDTFPAYHISSMWWDGDVSVRVQGTCLKSQHSSRRLEENFPHFWHCFRCHNLRCNGEKTHWTIVSAADRPDWICRSRGDKTGSILSNCCSLGRVGFSRDDSTKLDVYLIFNRLGNDGTSSGRSNGGLSLPPCTSSPGMSRLHARDRNALQRSQRCCHIMYISLVTLGKRETATRGRYLNVHVRRFNPALVTTARACK